MKVFLSWSGNRSRTITEVFKIWLPNVLQAVRPYFSPDDVTKGARWLTEISKELEESRFALLIITPENQEAPWLLFEAGALSKSFDRSKVCPLLFGGMDPADVKGPLVQFQGAKFGKEEMKKVLKSINAELGESALTPDTLENVFEKWWPEFEEGVERKIKEETLKELDKSNGEVKRSDRELLEEILALIRKTAMVEIESERMFDYRRHDEALQREYRKQEMEEQRQDFMRIASEMKQFMSESERLRQSLASTELDRLKKALASSELDRQNMKLIDRLE
ncbi:MAG: TIR domain-containing protein [Terracidiphilus sp.]|jgi:hypothetical protein